jgi:hypothetical protein
MSHYETASLSLRSEGKRKDIKSQLSATAGQKASWKLTVDDKCHIKQRRIELDIQIDALQRSIAEMATMRDLGRTVVGLRRQLLEARSKRMTMGY